MDSAINASRTMGSGDEDDRIGNTLELLWSSSDVTAARNGMLVQRIVNFWANNDGDVKWYKVYFRMLRPQPIL
jgi:hypothetical protein